MVEDTPTQYPCLHERGRRHIWVRRQANNKVLQQNSKWIKKIAIETSWSSRGWEGTIDKSGNVIACHCCIFHGLIFSLSHSPSLFSSLSNQVFPQFLFIQQIISQGLSVTLIFGNLPWSAYLSQKCWVKNALAGGRGQNAGFAQLFRVNLHRCVLYESLIRMSLCATTFNPESVLPRDVRRPRVCAHLHGSMGETRGEKRERIDRRTDSWTFSHSLLRTTQKIWKKGKG